MPLISLAEILALGIVSLYMGYIFYDFIRFNAGGNSFSFEKFKYSILAAAPAVILHELAHKFMAIAMGYEAIFFAFYQSPFTLFLGLLSIFLKLIHSPLIFIIPGFVQIPTNIGSLQYRIIAFVGPATNLLLWAVASVLLRKNLNDKATMILAITKRINFWLFIFNMLPIGLFDGAKVIFGPP